MGIFDVVFSQITPGVDRFQGLLPAYHMIVPVYVVHPRYGSHLTLMSNRAVKPCVFPLCQGLGAVTLQGSDPVGLGNPLSNINSNLIFEQFDFSSVRGLFSCK